MNDGVIIKYEESSVIAVLTQENIINEDTIVICFDEGNTDLAYNLRIIISKNNHANKNPYLFQNKINMKEKLRNDNIKVPAFIKLNNTNISFNELKTDLGLPFVIKPVESAGSNSIYIINKKDDFKKAINDISKDTHSYEAESYINGELYHCDIAIFNNKMIFSECTKYLSPTVDFQKGCPLGGRVMLESSKLRNQLIEFTQKSIRSLGAVNGVYHTEIFVSDIGDLVFLESGARPPGMFVTKMYERAFGVNLLNLDVEIQAGLIRTKYKHTEDYMDSFYLVYPKGEGMVSTIESIPDIDEVDLSYRVVSEIGEAHYGCKSNIDYCAVVICSGKENKITTAYKTMKQFQPLRYL